MALKKFALLLPFLGLLLFGWDSPSFGAQARLDLALGRPVVKAGKAQKVFLKVNLTGLSFEKANARAPVNVAIVLDKSGSMSGEKIRRAREAAILAVERLNQNDIVSVVVYDSSVRVLLPATKLTDKKAVIRVIESIGSGGNTALFAGVSKGAHEVVKFLDRDRVNRVILVSDGQANVGPSRPSELGELGSSLAKSGISVTTIGLGAGYNEDLMMLLADRSDGNHAFAEDAADLARIFQTEFSDVLSVVCQEVVIRVNCADGVQPLRVLGREAEIIENTVTLGINQLYGDQEKYVMVELEVPPGKPGQTREVADVDVSYASLASQKREELRKAVSVRFSSDEKTVKENVQKKVLAASVEQIANERNVEAIKLRDEGKVQEAQVMLQSNVDFLKGNAEELEAPELLEQAQINEEAAQGMEDEKGWRVERKRQFYYQNKLRKQQK